MKIKENSTSFKSWLEPPATIYRKYYFFDVKNVDDVQSGREKPFLVERGPYTYREVSIIASKLNRNYLFK